MEPPTRRGAWTVAVGLVLLSAVAPVSAQSLLDEYRSYVERTEGWAPTAAGEVLGPPVPSFVGSTPEAWAERIDSYWGQGASTAEKLRIFDTVIRELEEEYGAFVNYDVDVLGLRERYRPEIAAGVSRGRFAAILNHISLAMMDLHTMVVDRRVNWGTVPRPGVPLLVAGAWQDASRFGAALTPLPDGSLLVIKARPNHVLGLRPGDRILGYDGVLWKDLIPQLLAAELPLLPTGCGSTRESLEHCLLMSAGLNWHLFETIDVVKYGTDEVLHLSTSPLERQGGQIWGGEQLEVAGVPMYDYPADEYVTWGIVEGSSIGYIYVAAWKNDARFQISATFHDAIQTLMQAVDTSGLIIDFRMNTGGSMEVAHAGYSLLFDQRLTKVGFDVRGSAADHLDMIPHPTFGPWLFTIPGSADTYYDRPIAVLTGPGAISNGDWESLRMRFHPMVRVFGKPSNGAFTLSDHPYLGDDWYFTKATGSGVLLDGHVYLAHVGAPVDEEVWLTPDDVAAGRDTVVEAAIAWIRNPYPRRPRRRLRGNPPSVSFPGPAARSSTAGPAR